MARRWLTFFVILAAVLIVDQVTKSLVVNNLRLGDTLQPIPALSPVFQITYSQNSGAAFGILPQTGDLFLVIAVLVVIAMLFFYPRVPDENGLTRAAMGLVCGGALGNALDRIEYGAVIDFILYRIPNVISNVSNLADHAIVLGVLLILYDSWRTDRRKAAQPADQVGEL
jgi:signal peptidase II